MISNPFFLLSLVISSTLAFFTTALLVETFLKIFRCKNFRVRASLRMLPFLSLLVDLVLNQYSISHWISPLSCASCVQKLILEVFTPQVKTYLVENETSLIQYLGANYHHIVFSCVFIVFASISLFFVSKTLMQSLSLTRSMHVKGKQSKISLDNILNFPLKNALKDSGVGIYLSNETLAPLTVYPKTIILPENNHKVLSQEEFEAVVAHELGHIRSWDPITRLIIHAIGLFFWWVPSYSWIKKVEQDQEMACDQNVFKYDIAGDFIASALCKVARQIQGHQALCYFHEQKNSSLLRIEQVLGLRVDASSSILGLNFFGVSVAGILLLICVMYL